MRVLRQRHVRIKPLDQHVDLAVIAHGFTSNVLAVSRMSGLATAAATSSARPYLTKCSIGTVTKTAAARTATGPDGSPIRPSALVQIRRPTTFSTIARM